MTGSSGGGFALMVEALGWRAAPKLPWSSWSPSAPAPAPACPPARSRATSVFVLSAGQGDFPRAVLAPGTPARDLP